MKSRMKFLVVDDHQIFRKSFIHLFATIFKPAPECVEACNGVEALQKLQKSKFDSIFIDVDMPEMNGIDACKTIRSLYPQVPIIVLTHHDDPELIFHFFKIGVQSFLSKNAAIKEIKTAIEHMRNGERYFPKEVELIIRRETSLNVDKSKIELSSQEKRLFELLRKGRTSKQIAHEMKLSSATVETYRKRLLEKTKTDNVAQLISFGFRTGILNNKGMS